MNFFVTFGQAHPLRDYWVKVIAKDEGEARRVVADVLGQKFAFVYLEKDFHPQYFPGGEVGEPIIGG